MSGKIFIACCFATLVVAVTPAKVDPGLIDTFSTGKVCSNIIVKFKGGNSAPLSTSAFSTLSEEDAATDLVANLKAHAESSQANALKLFRSRSRYSASVTKIDSLWVTNELYVEGADEAMVEQLASLPEVEEIHEELIIPLEAILPSPEEETQDITNAGNEWNVRRVKAHEVWALPGGNKGENVVVANIDTGVRWTHEALRHNYRRDYGWFDPYTLSRYPVDSNGHGTHTMGTITGSKGIGVAPGAKWIACRGCFGRTCSESSLKRCGQWVLCPTNAAGSNPDCSKRPRVVSNSWGGGQNLTFYNEVIDAWKAANIIPVFSIGNRGPNCGTAGSPGDQDVISVGSIDSADRISFFSSAGPAINGKLKPEISAPGQLVRSSWFGNDRQYNIISGTSMACPHVAGTVALLLSKSPSLTYTDVLRILTQNTDRNVPNTGSVCGGIPSTAIPNNQYGYGILNARKAVGAI